MNMTRPTSVVALPGILLGKTCWNPLDKLIESGGYRFIAHNFPGYDGRERLPMETPTPEDYADDLHYQMADSSSDRVHLLAHCSGCSPALAFAQKYPDKVASITLIAYWHGTKEWESRKAVLTEGVEEYARKRLPLLIAKHEDPETSASVVGKIVDAVTDAEGFFQMARSIMQHHAKSCLAQVDLPLHFIVGSSDLVTLPAAQANIALGKGAELSMIDGGSHCMFFDDPEPVAKVCQKFWGGLSK